MTPLHTPSRELKSNGLRLTKVRTTLPLARLCLRLKPTQSLFHPQVANSEYPWRESALSEKALLIVPASTPSPEAEPDSSRESSIRSSRTWTAGFKPHHSFKRGLSFLSNVSSAVTSPRREVPEVRSPFLVAIEEI